MIPALTAAAAMWWAWLVGKEVRERHETKTVEQEQQASRDVVASLGQHSPGITVGEYVDEYDDARWHLIDEIHRANTASM